jgi:hypothetical protein
MPLQMILLWAHGLNGVLGFGVSPFCMMTSDYETASYQRKLLQPALSYGLSTIMSCLFHS